MKRILALVAVLVMMGSLCSCGKNTNAFKVSKAAYSELKRAYEIIEAYSSDVYIAWMCGIYHDDEILEQGTEYLASQLSLSEDEIRDGVAHTFSCDFWKQDWDTVSEEDKQTLRDLSDGTFSLYEEDLFSFCIQVVSNAYAANGKTAEIEGALSEAKAQMKTLSEKYSDYTYYPKLKEFYTTVDSFFHFCEDPFGNSFKQMTDAIEKYKNQARVYQSDLDYIFED